MRKCSIKMKVTLWYTGILSVILGIVLAGIFIFTNVTGLSVTEEFSPAAASARFSAVEPMPWKSLNHSLACSFSLAAVSSKRAAIWL